MSLAVPLTHLVELTDAEQRLGADLAGRDATWSAEPSSLPAWTRAHVVAHLAGNAAGMINLVTWASMGVETPMYPSAEQRAAEIERRAVMPWEDLRDEQQRLAGELTEALQRLTEPVAARDLRLGSGAAANVCDLAAVRIREVEIHRVDLRGEYRPDHWSAPFTLRTLSQVAPFFAEYRSVPVRYLRASDSGSCWLVGVDGPDLVGCEGDLLAWLLGRPHGEITPTDGRPLPTAPAWV